MTASTIDRDWQADVNPHNLTRNIEVKRQRIGKVPVVELYLRPKLRGKIRVQKNHMVNNAFASAWARPNRHVALPRCLRGQKPGD
jgi:hypothetical protein